ncbi:hypothetical protein CMI37_27075 [Candidatus Pacearchaeota archaeon]|nr:hypothetical protein [Candidatus Pacearchaeota archaeon]|tara:strand:- start:289 stop:906 length:618 start_codon:yes stop_codon:yes gene_type:complete
MLKKKCPNCAKKIEKKFSYCPYCGLGFRKQRDEENFGMLGRDDVIEREPTPEIKMPFGLNKIMNSLVKQLEKEMGNMGEVQPGGGGRGFKIQISTGKPQVKQMPMQKKEEKMIMPVISERELERREGLERTDADSKVKRLSDKIVYEINVPGVRGKDDVIITRLEEGIEIRAYSKDKCYVKVIPLKVEVLGWYLKQDVLVVELKG